MDNKKYILINCFFYYFYIEEYELLKYLSKSEIIKYKLKYLS